MKKLRNLIAAMAMMSMAAVLTGCGDDDDNDDDDQPPVNNIVAPGDEAALTAQNKIYTVTIPGETNTITLTFPSAGRYQAVQGEITEQGAISDAVRNVNTWTFNITPDANQEGAQAGSVRLDFTAADQGTFTFTPTEGEVQTGTFVLTTDPGSGDDGGNGGGGALSNQSLQVNYPGVGGERFDFTSATAMTYEPTGANVQGNYTWDPTTRVIDIALNNNSTFQITLAAGNTGTATVVFRENPSAEPQTSTGDYTLSPGL